MKYFSVFSLIIFQFQILCAQQIKSVNEVKYTLNKETIEIELLNNNMVHILKYQGTNAPLKDNLIVLDIKGAFVKSSVRETNNSFILQSSSLKIELNKNKRIINEND